jgi:hypothetical protein
MTLESIKEAISGLPENDKASLASWIIEQDMDDWDREMHRDFSSGGRGTALVERIGADVRAGKFRPMDKGRPAE